MERKNDYCLIGLQLAIAFVLIFSSFSIQQRTASAVGPTFMPRLVAAGLVLCAACQLVVTLRKPAAAAAKKEAGEARPREKGSLLDLVMNRYGHFTIWGCMVVYAFTMQTLGFILSSIFMIFAASVLLSRKEDRNYVRFLVIAVVGSVIIYFVFVRAFKLILPVGFLTFLR